MMMMVVFKLFFIWKLVSRGATLIFVSVYLIHLWARYRRRLPIKTTGRVLPDEPKRLEQRQLKGQSNAKNHYNVAQSNEQIRSR